MTTSYRRAISVLVVALTVLVGVYAGVEIGERRHAAARREEKRALDENRRRAEEIRKQREQEKQQEEVRRAEELRQQQEAERRKQQQEREGRRVAAVEFILRKFPAGIQTSNPIHQKKWHLFGYQDEYAYTLYSRRRFFVSIDGCQLTLTEKAFADTRTSEETGDLVDTYTQTVSVASLDPTRIEVVPDSLGHGFSLKLNATASSNVIEREHWNRQQGTENWPAVGHAWMHVGFDDEGRRVAEQLKRAFEQLIGTCGGAGEVF